MGRDMDGVHVYKWERENYILQTGKGREGQGGKGKVLCIYEKKRRQEKQNDQYDGIYDKTDGLAGWDSHTLSGRMMMKSGSLSHLFFLF